MNKDCSRNAEDLTALAMGELQGAEADRIREHLAVCSDCRSAFEETEHLLNLAEGLPRIAAPADLHGRIMSSVDLEKEAGRLSTVDRVRLFSSFVAYQLRTSGKARFLFVAAAAQILVLLTLFVASNLIVQKTEGPRRFVDIRGEQDDSLSEKKEEEEEESALVFDEDLKSRTPSDWKIDPLSFPLEMPEIAMEESEEIVPPLMDELDRRIDRENRIELSRYRMYARFSMRCKDHVLRGKGGDDKTEYAVERGLKWLRLHQVDNGSWFPGGPFGGDPRATVGITALSVATFLSGGHTEESGRYAETVQDGISFLLANQDRQGRFGWTPEAPGISLFNQSTAVLVLAENYILCDGAHEEVLAYGIRALIGITDEADAEEIPEGAVQVLNAYSETWAAMALRTAVMTGVEVPQLSAAARRADKRVALLARNESRAGVGAGITASIPPIATATGEALNALFHEDPAIPAGLHPDPDTLPFPDPKDPKTLFDLLENSDFREPTFLFFISTGLCKEGDDLWEDWNSRVKDLLLEEQDRDGLWPVSGDWPWIDGGDIYTTALHLLTLQVYYRYIKLEENCQ